MKKMGSYLENTLPKGEGQSLIETIVAIGMITVAIVAILSVGLSNLMLSGQSSERVMATNLAREGIEIVNAIRSSQRLDPDQTWPYGMADGNWILAYNTENLSTNTAVFSGGSDINHCTNCYLCQDITNDYYNSYYSSTSCVSEQVFRRLVTISVGDDLGGNCSNCEKKIISTVYWQERGRPHSIQLETRLTDWR